jgi:hypothetical protein
MNVSMSDAGPSGVISHSLADLIEELSGRMQTGEPVNLEAYLAEHSEHADELRRLFPALQMLADFSRSDLANVPTEQDEAGRVVATWVRTPLQKFNRIWASP